MTPLEQFDLKPNEQSNKMEIASPLEKYQILTDGKTTTTTN